jgi:O-succinylbenzoic acid--CoA ligase
MDWLAQAAAERPDHPAVVFGKRSITYRDLDRAADAVAGIVGGSGLSGGAVAFWGVREPATVAALWGIPRAGFTAVPIDPRLPPAEAMQLTRDAGVTGLWALPDGGFDRLLSRRATLDHPAWGPPDPACRFVVFTSGTEGRHRGVVLTGANVAAAIGGSRRRLGTGAEDSWLCVLPLFHVGGLSIPWRQAEAAATIVLEETFDPARTSGLMAAVTHVSLVPTMLRRVLAAGATGSCRVLVGGGPADPSLLRRAAAAGLMPLQTYGMTETTSQACTVAPDEFEEALGTAGRPIAGTEVRVTRDGSTAAAGAEGRIEVRGPIVSPGYLGEPFRDPGAWFVTGDLGSIDEEGRLTVAGRADSVIVTGGEKVHPSMVERILRQCPGVVDTRVFGVPDPEWGRRVVAEVIVDGVTVGEVGEWAHQNLSPAAVPKEWRTVPKVTGKLDS